MIVDISHIRKLIKLIHSSDITEIEVTEGDHTVRISRQGSAATVAAPVAQPAMAAALVAAPAQAAAAAPAQSSADDENVVNSPMVGTYYGAPSPDVDDFITEGSKVKKGDTLCIIEAMKLMNEIEAEYDGVVESILVSNASPVEYGQGLFVITPL
jgi:acetyl-CoA carboxylase biotin carboxyl carrier protein